jgi:hypothetical protein
MRRIAGTVLLGLFGFLLAAGLVAQFYAPGALTKTPLDIDSLTKLTGEGSYLGEPVTPVKVWKRTQAVADTSTSDVIVMRDFSCVMKDPEGNAPDEPVCLDDSDPRLISASEELFATDRVSGMAVNDPEYIGTTGEEREGLVNKFPFDTQQETYPLWDGVLGAPVDAVFADVEDIDGLETYRFTVSISEAPIEVAEGVPGFYNDDRSIWVDPVTGTFIDQQQHQVRSLEDGGTALDLTLGFTPDTVQTNVDSARSNGRLLGILALVPWIAYLLALGALVGGILLLRSAPPAPARHRSDAEDVTFDELRGAST